jgi:O-antigen ligase
MMQSAVDIWLSNPFTGVGLNNFQFYSQYSSTFPYFQTLAEQGIVGFVLFAGVIGYVLYVAYRTVTAPEPPSPTFEGGLTRVAITVLGIVLVADLGGALFMNTVYSLRFWFFVAVLAGLATDSSFRWPRTNQSD